MSEEAQNALLKTLEEPPPDTFIILLAPSLDRMLATTRSRSVPGTICRGYCEALGQSRLKRSLPFCSDFECVQLMRAPQRDCVAYGFSSVT